MCVQPVYTVANLCLNTYYVFETPHQQRAFNTATQRWGAERAPCCQPDVCSQSSTADVTVSKPRRKSRPSTGMCCTAASTSPHTCWRLPGRLYRCLCRHPLPGWSCCSQGQHSAQVLQPHAPASWVWGAAGAQGQQQYRHTPSSSNISSGT